MLKLAFSIDQMFIKEEEDGDKDDFDLVHLVRRRNVSENQVVKETKTTELWSW